VCAILITKPASLENVRVLLLAPDGSDYRESVFLRSEGAITVQCGSYEETIECGIVIDVRDYEGLYAGETAIFTALQDEAISICDEDGAVLGNGYMGHIEVRYYDEGYTVINQLPLEDYLTAVVPSEMPSSYEPEALKAQAICARSYACIQLLKGDLARYGAHINDSASYQVYNKVAPTEASIRAVYETAGQILTYEGDIVEAYYFSTSMGYTDTAAVWNVSDEGSYGYLGKVCLNYEDTVDDLSDEEGFYDYITSENTGYDSDIKFYRWQAAVDFSDMADEVISALTSRYSTTSDNIKIYDNDMNEMTEGFQKLGEVKEISVEERSASGAVLCLKITFNKGTAYIKNEYNIRKISGCALSHITWKDGSENNEMTILPSSFFSPVRQKDGSYILYGGGYGHGLGMSQNGANGMAKSGADCEEILQYFYHDIKIEKM
jgi:stage II sporulation protein D